MSILRKITGLVQRVYEVPPPPPPKGPELGDETGNVAMGTSTVNYPPVSPPATGGGDPQESDNTPRMSTYIDSYGQKWLVVYAGDRLAYGPVKLD